MRLLPFAFAFLLASACRGNFARTSDATPESVLLFARAHLAGFGDTAKYLGSYDRSSDFVDVERGRLKSWQQHDTDVREFFRNANAFRADWEPGVKVVLIGGNAAVLTGVARYRFTLSDEREFDNRQATTLALRFQDGHWRILQQHGSPATDSR